MKKLALGLVVALGLGGGLFWIKRKPIVLWMIAHGYGKYLGIKPVPGYERSGPPPVYKVTREVQVVVPAEEVKGAMTNLASVLQTVRAVPYLSADNQFAGFQISRLEPTSLFAKAGLKEGDIIRVVNDVTLDHPGKGLAAFQAMRNSKAPTAIITRGKENFLIRWKL